MEQEVSVTEVRRQLGRYVRAAEAGRRIVITRYGRRVAVLSPWFESDRSWPLEKELALERILARGASLGGRLAPRHELHDR